MYIYICIHLDVCIYIYTYKYTHIYIHIHVYIYIYTQTYIYTYLHLIKYILICVHTYIYIYIYVCRHRSTHSSKVFAPWYKLLFTKPTCQTVLPTTALQVFRMAEVPIYCAIFFFLIFYIYSDTLYWGQTYVSAAHDCSTGTARTWSVIFFNPKSQINDLVF